ncbi:kinase-like domain-containing protein [Gigaspora rosea]|uniref:Kinase-like domain-containing protein n=1 Tax=Gigaspora rosea TaxID=44941 RepID=A0A397W3B6_9GLOM|nr:kinase-like domain-containing protein [Gigaspora rosea]
MIHKIKILDDVNHQNVIKFFGTSRNHETGNFMIILQYANNGNLRDHLKKKQIEGIYKISCAEVFRIAKQIVSGLKYLHDKNIIHRDLHSKNILIIDDDKVLIADFGIAKSLNDSSTLSSRIAGMSPYIDCQCIKHIKGAPDKESDIYSLGVLFWELTSGVPPFNKLPMAAAIIEISKGRREETVENTPPDYADLYKNCWSSHSAERPTLEYSLSVLEKLSKEIIDEIITNNVEHDYLYNGPNTSKGTIKL